MNNNIKRFLMMSVVVAITLLLPATSVSQDNTSDFELLKSELSESSLPLVNITVDLENVSRESYTNASIEIVDPLMRTDGNVSTMLSCKVKSSTHTDKNVYIQDIAYQMWILKNCPIRFSDTARKHIGQQRFFITFVRACRFFPSIIRCIFLSGHRLRKSFE